MISGPRHLFEQRCRERGYTLDEVLACIVAEDGDSITVDETHAAYPSRPKVSGAGPGAELKKLLGMIGITATSTCSCNAHAVQMDAWGADECERRLDEIVGWLEGEARGRHLLFSATVARQVVRLAIRRARKAAAQ